MIKLGNNVKGLFAVVVIYLKKEAPSVSKEDQQHIFEIMLKLMKKKEYGAALCFGIFMIRDHRVRFMYYIHLYMQTFHCACYIYFMIKNDGDDKSL